MAGFDTFEKEKFILPLPRIETWIAQTVAQSLN
jgi:hypothetical protein